MFKKLLAGLLAFIAATAFATVDVNKASQTELEAVQGIGPAVATKIVKERSKGSFKDWSDVMDRVAGIKGAKAAKLSAAGLTVNGAAYDGSAAPAPKKSAKPAKKADAAPADAAPPKKQ
ncbi:ComEA family DNA-binding protein [Piscinibacter sp.]|uniref:ComEA family DNA-binding protein n=1 Tax=Piscinibacter sp. TaxID=1903157 RepID=UPI002B585623|nr:helix-hairpin-helix domain-containing protein [Albitalea sp.]HUG24683.1 helix-hairpin-helix domain-containing protein [Albitalea sp.]